MNGIGLYTTTSPTWISTGDGSPDDFVGSALPSVRQPKAPELDYPDAESALTDHLRWGMTQPDRQDLFLLTLDEWARVRSQRPPVDVDAFHEKLLRTRIRGLLIERGLDLSIGEWDAVFKACWEEGGGWGTSPEDVQINRYISCAVAPSTEEGLFLNQSRPTQK